jgi:phenylacetate-CoA ligase
MATAREYYDSLETQDPAERERRLFAALPDLVAHAKAKAPHLGELLKDVAPAAVTGRAALAGLPVIRKSDFIDLQKKDPPFGGLVAAGPGVLGRIFQSPGPIYDPEGRADDWWRTARALFAAGFRKGDVVHNTFSYHLSPGGFIMDCGARALGCTVIPAGVGQTEQQVQIIADVRPACYAGTPSFLKILLGKAAEAEADAGSIRKAFVSGEALPPSLRKEFQDRGITVRQGYATADLGLVAYESEALEGMIVSENLIVEIVRPGTGDPVPEGEVGEVVVTTFTREYPLIRFATGDLSAVLPGVSPCGRTNMRIKGWMGRADQTTKVKGMFVHPNQVAEVVKRHPQIVKGRLVVDRKDDNDVMIFQCEAPAGGDDLAGAVGATLQVVCKLKGAVVVVPPGSLPNDGKVIDDIRKYD